MNRSRLLAHLVSTVIAAAMLLVGPLSLDTSYAAAERCATTASCAVDTDADGVPDTSDGCPTVAASTSTGCPTASRTASLTWVASTQRLEGRVTSPASGCSRRARIVLWRTRPDRDVKVLGVGATSSGRYRFAVQRGSRYYVTVSPSYASGQAECGRATSRTVLAPRR